MTNLMALNAYKCMVRNLRLLVTMQDPLVLSLSNKTKIKITNLFTARDLNTDLKRPDGPKCIEETNEDVVNLFGEARPLPLRYCSQQIEPKDPVVTKSPPWMSALTSRPLNVAAPHNVVPSDNNGSYRFFFSPHPFLPTVRGVKNITTKIISSRHRQQRCNGDITSCRRPERFHYQTTE